MATKTRKPRNPIPKDIFDQQQRWEGLLRQLCPNIDHSSGIYLWKREENGKIYMYIGKSKNLLQRSVSHCMGYEQHIDRSIRHWKFYHKDTNRLGWELYIKHFPESELDHWERKYIDYYRTQPNVELYNIEGGGTEGKTYLTQPRPRKGYRDGVEQGYRKARKFVAELFANNLEFSINGKLTVNKQKAYDKFKDFININENGE